MAARHLRRLRGDDGLGPPALAPGSGDDDDDAPSATSSSPAANAPPAAPPFNPFALLDEGGGSGGGDSDTASSSSGGGGRSKRGTGSPGPPPRPHPSAATTTASTKKKKNKKKGGGSGKALDDVDAALAELGLEVPTTAAGGEEEEGGGGGDGGGGASPPSLLAVAPRALRGDDEARRLFGDAATSRGVIGAGHAAANAAPAVGAGVRRRAGGGPARSGRRPAAARPRGPLLGGATPPGRSPSGGLTMAALGSGPGGTSRFAYTPGPLYEAGASALASAQALHDPAEIFRVVRDFPGHAPSLLVASDLCCLTGQHDDADALLDAAAGALEAGFHPAFADAAAAGTARLDGAAPANAPLFSLLARRASAAGRRGLPRTAFATALLLLGLDPTGDPTGARCAIDFYALRAGRHDWVVRAVGGELDTAPGLEDGEGDGAAATASLASMPNWAFSAGLAALRLAGDDAAAQRAAAARLTKAALTHPAAVLALAARLPTHPALDAALARPPFTDAAAAGSTGSASLDRLVAIFAERSWKVWKARDAHDALAAAAREAADTAASSPLAAKAWAVARTAAWPPGTPDAYAHLRVSEFSDEAAAIPADELAALQADGRLGGGAGPGRGRGGDGGGGGGGGALPAAAQAAGGAGGADVDALLARLGPVRALLGALAPWNDWAAEGGGAEGGEEGTDGEDSEWEAVPDAVARGDV